MLFSLMADADKSVGSWGLRGYKDPSFNSECIKETPFAMDERQIFPSTIRVELRHCVSNFRDNTFRLWN